MENKKKRLISLIWVLLAALLIVSIFLIKYDFPKNIDLLYPAVQYRIGDPSSAEETTIKINGILYRPIFGEPSFKGDIMIEKYDYTNSYELIDVSFSGNSKMGALADDVQLFVYQVLESIQNIKK